MLWSSSFAQVINNITSTDLPKKSPKWPSELLHLISYFWSLKHKQPYFDGRIFKEAIIKEKNQNHHLNVDATSFRKL